MSQNSPSPTPPPINPRPDGEDPYAFIMQNSPAAKKPKIPGFNKNSLVQRIVVVLVGVIILIIVVDLGIGWLNASQKAGLNDMVAVARKQAEIIRIASLGEKSSKDAVIANLAVTTRLSVVSEQTQMLALLKTRGSKITASSLAAVKNKALEDNLTAAQQNNSFDQTFDTAIKDELKQYKNLLLDAYKLNKGTKTRAALNLAYGSASDLIAKPETTAN